jgi:hypothetical protein
MFNLNNDQKEEVLMKNKRLLGVFLPLVLILSIFTVVMASIGDETSNGHYCCVDYKNFPAGTFDVRVIWGDPDRIYIVGYSGYSICINDERISNELREFTIYTYAIIAACRAERIDKAYFNALEDTYEKIKPRWCMCGVPINYWAETVSRNIWFHYIRTPQFTTERCRVDNLYDVWRVGSLCDPWREYKFVRTEHDNVHCPHRR